MGSRQFVDVYGIEAFRRLGIDDQIFEEELRTEREKVVRSLSARARERI